MRWGLADRWRAPGAGTATDAEIAPVADISGEMKFYEELVASKPALIDEKVKIHGRIIDDLNMALLDGVSREDLGRQVKSFVVDYAVRERLALNQKELDAFSEEVFAELVGLGPIEPLLKDPTVNDILINTHASVYVERYGQLESTGVRFKDESHLLRIINKMVATVGRRVDESSPMVDARLPDGSRVNVAIRPVAVDGPLVSIRKFSKRPFAMDRLVDIGALKPQIAAVLAAAVKGRISLIVSGGTGSGKTTMLNALSSFISPLERLITIEDAAELQLQQHHVARMETRPPSTEGKGEIRQRELVKNALRMRPDRIIIGECRGEEAFDMLQAMNTGHEGSMTTIHANNPRDAVRRLEQMVGMAAPMSVGSIRGQIASAIQLVIQLQRLSDGKRRLTSVSEITGTEGDIIQMQEIFRFVREGHDAQNGVVGHFRATGVRPRFTQDLKAHGIEIPGDYFEPTLTL